MTCVQKCCDDGQFLNENFTCAPRPHTVRFTLEFRNLDGSVVPDPPNIRVVNFIPNCEDIDGIPFTDPQNTIYLLQSGHVYEGASATRHPVNRYCIEYDMEDSAGQSAFVCREPEVTSSVLVVKQKLQLAASVVSLVFLTFTIGCHGLLPELRDVQGLCLVCHMVSLLVFNLANIISFGDLNNTHCIVIGLTLQFSLLSTFSWLSVMCFDIWRVIRATVKCVPLAGILARDGTKFKLYCACAWGGPLLMTVVTAVIHYLPQEARFEGLLRPGLGKISCWFSKGDAERLVYFYWVAGVLFAANLFMIGHSNYLLYTAGNAFNCIAKRISATTINRHHLEAFWQRFALFSLMAVCWVMEILAWKIEPEEIWLVTDVVNSLQGFLVFAVFISSKKKRALLVRLCHTAVARLRCEATRIEDTYSTDPSHSTNDDTHDCDDTE